MWLWQTELLPFRNKQASSGSLKSQKAWSLHTDYPSWSRAMFGGLLVDTNLYAAGDFSKSNQAFPSFRSLKVKLKKSWTVQTVAVRTFSTIFHRTFSPSKPFYLHLSDHQHFGFWHSQVIWSFNLLKRIAASSLPYKSHWAAITPWFLLSERQNYKAFNKKDMLYSTHVASFVIAAPQASDLCMLSVSWHYLSELHKYKYVSTYNVHSMSRFMSVIIIQPLLGILGSSIKSHSHNVFFFPRTNVQLFDGTAWWDNNTVLLWEQICTVMKA